MKGIYKEKRKSNFEHKGYLIFHLNQMATECSSAFFGLQIVAPPRSYKPKKCRKIGHSRLLYFMCLRSKVQCHKIRKPLETTIYFYSHLRSADLCSPVPNSYQPIQNFVLIATKLTRIYCTYIILHLFYYYYSRIGTLYSFYLYRWFNKIGVWTNASFRPTKLREALHEQL